MPGLNYELIVPPTVEPVSLSLAKKQLRVDIPDDDDIIQSYIESARDYCEGFTKRAFYPQTWKLFLDSFPYGDYRETVPMDQRNPWNYSAYWSDFAIRLPKPMTQSVQAINYLDAGGNPQVLATDLYTVDYNSRPCRIVPAAGQIWPITQFYQPGSINIPYVAASYAPTITDENVALTDGVGILANQVISITSVTDTSDNALAYTSAPVTDTNGDPTSQTKITVTSPPNNNIVVVTYQAGMLPAAIRQAILLIIGHLYEHREENSEITLKEMPMGVEKFLRRFVFENFGNYRSGY